MHELKVAWQFFKRDLFVYKRIIPRLVVQYSVTSALMYGTCFGYLLPLVGMQRPGMTSSTIFVSLAFYALWQSAYVISTDFLFDFEKDRFIHYQLTIISSHSILLERILFNSLLGFLAIIPYYLTVKLVFWNYLDVSQLSVPKLLILLYLSTLLCASVQVAYACLISNSRQIRHFYRRVTYPLAQLGGILVPWKAMMAFSSLLGYGVLLNPIIYITEGLRAAMLGSEQFLPYWYSAFMLAFYSFIITGLATNRFKKKVGSV